MMHESWTGTFIQGMVMGAGMMVVMMVPGLARRAGWARWGGRAGRLTRHCEEEALPPTKQSGRLLVIARSAQAARRNNTSLRGPKGRSNRVVARLAILARLRAAGSLFDTKTRKHEIGGRRRARRSETELRNLHSMV